MKSRVLPQYRELLNTYRIYHKRVEIGSMTTAGVQKTHLKAADFYIQILNYYISSNWFADELDLDMTDRTFITEQQAEDIYFKLIRALKDANQVYYE
jgi:hypothetical protein